MRVLTAEQSRTFLEAAMKTPYGPVFVFALTTAARPSEYLGVRWDDINWDCGTVAIVRTLVRAKGNWRFADTKRSRSRRVIKLQTWVLKILKDLRARTQTCGCSWPGAADLVFWTPTGRPIHADKLAKRFKSILHHSGLPMIRLYDLRHTGATLALAVGVPPKVVSEQLGHVSAAFTLDVYAHVLPHMQAEAAARVEDLLYPVKAGAPNSSEVRKRKPPHSARNTHRNKSEAKSKQAEVCE
jgi:integrase